MNIIKDILILLGILEQRCECGGKLFGWRYDRSDCLKCGKKYYL